MFVSVCVCEVEEALVESLPALSVLFSEMLTWLLVHHTDAVTTDFVCFTVRMLTTFCRERLDF